MALSQVCPTADSQLSCPAENSETVPRSRAETRGIPITRCGDFPHSRPTPGQATERPAFFSPRSLPGLREMHAVAVALLSAVISTFFVCASATTTTFDVVRRPVARDVGVSRVLTSRSCRPAVHKVPRHGLSLLRRRFHRPAYLTANCGALHTYSQYSGLAELSLLYECVSESRCSSCQNQATANQSNNCLARAAVCCSLSACISSE
jgi:hypothetical protein